ncbi:MAG: SPOR domain-containing protein, partial [Proteobacteria bacterium]|nr:SPOR domain-containing protein [Pseudomonadota bacterium]
AYNNRGSAWFLKGDYDRAIADYTKAIDINPRYTNAYRNRGIIYSKQGDYIHAIEDYNVVLKLQPSDWIYNQLALLLIVCPDKKYRDGEKAIQLAQKSLAIKREIKSLGILAAAYAEAGKFDEAVTTQKSVIEMLQNENKPEDLSEHYERLKIYQANVTLQERLMALQQEKRSGIVPDSQDKIVQPASGQPTDNTVKVKNHKVYPYTIQISAFREQETSARVALKFRNMGDPVFNSYAHIQSSGEDWYRIFFGFYETLEAAQHAVSALKKRKFRYADVLKMPYTVQVGSFDSEAELNKIDVDLQQKNYIACRVPDGETQGKTRLLVGAFKTKKAAEKQAVKIQKIGLTPEVVQR